MLRESIIFNKLLEGGNQISGRKYHTKSTLRGKKPNKLNRPATAKATQTKLVKLVPTKLMITSGEIRWYGCRSPHWLGSSTCLLQ